MGKWLSNSLVRCRRSFGYCRDALAGMVRAEPSFRLELLAGAVLVVALLASPWPAWKKLLMLAAFLLIPLAEILNTAIENICDLVTGERHPLVKKAKDNGALAVLTAIIINVLVLAALLAT